MKWYTKALIVLTFVLACIGAAAASCAILVTDFTPTAVCAGEETYAVAERLNNRWCVSVLNPDGTLRHDISFSADNADRETALRYADDIYYFWTVRHDGTDGNGLTVRRISSETNEKDTVETQLNAEAGEQLGGMHIYEGTLSVTGWHDEADQTVLSVYLAGKDAAMFSKELTYTLSQTYFIRNAYYRSDGSVVFLTASGRVYVISELEQQPVLLYDGAWAPASDFCLDAEDKICLLDCDGETIRLTDSNMAEPCLESFGSQLSYTFSGMELAECSQISLMSDNCAAVLFLDENGNWNAGLYQNGMLHVTDSIFHSSWWLFALLFLGLTILLGSAAFLLLFGIWYFFRGTVTMQCRVSVVCIAVAAVVLTVISVNIYQRYTQQKEEQDWERLTIMLNNADIYLDPENQKNLEQLGELDWDQDVQTGVKDEFVQRLWAFSNADVSENNSCLLFVRTEDGVLTAVSGNSVQIGKEPEQIYNRETAKELSHWKGKEEEQLSGTFQKDGVSWMYLAKSIFGETEEPMGLLVMQMPSEHRGEPWILAADLILYLAVISFLMILLLRIRYVLRPLRQMEVQAQKFILTGNCEPIPVKGHNEITVLTRRFQQAVSELKKSMSQSQRSAECYGRFVDKSWIELMGKENLSALHVGDCAEHILAVLEMRLTPHTTLPLEDARIQQYQGLYARILPAIQKNNGIPESLSPERMRFLFPKGCFDAVCAASVVREVVQEQFQLEAVMDYGRTMIRVCGDDAHMRICSEMQEEMMRMPLLHQTCCEFGCQILVTGEVVQAISDFQTIFNCRTIGFFSLQQKGAKAIRHVEILPQRCSDTFERAVRLYQAGSYVEAFGMFSAVVEKNPNDCAAVRYLHLCYQALQETGR